MQFRGRQALTTVTPKAESTSAMAGDSNRARSYTATSEDDLKRHAVVRLQRTIGNQAVLRMMRAHVGHRKTGVWIARWNPPGGGSTIPPAALGQLSKLGLDSAKIAAFGRGEPVFS